MGALMMPSSFDRLASKPGSFEMLVLMPASCEELASISDIFAWMATARRSFEMLVVIHTSFAKLVSKPGRFEMLLVHRDLRIESIDQFGTFCSPSAIMFFEANYVQI